MKRFVLTALLITASAGAVPAQDQQAPPKPEKALAPANQSVDPELSALQRQNKLMEERLRLLTQQQQIKTVTRPDPLAAQNEILSLRARLVTQGQQINQLLGWRQAADVLDIEDRPTIESVRLAYSTLSALAPDVARALSCTGKTVVLYGPAQSEALLSVRTYNDQTELLRNRLKAILNLGVPLAPDKPEGAAAAKSSSVYGVNSLSNSVLQSVLDLTALFQSGTVSSINQTADETGIIATVANAAVAQGCNIYWPDQYVTNPYNPGSQILQTLEALAELNDNGGVDGKPAGLQQRIAALRTELKRAETTSENLADRIGATSSRLTEASKKVEGLRQHIEFLSAHIKDERNANLQEKLNRTFEKAWEELETAIRRQLVVAPPSTIEEQNRIGELSKRLDLLKTRADWLAQYVRDEKDLQLQDKVKKSLSGYWDQLDTSEKAFEQLAATTPQALEADQNEQKKWDRYAADLRELIATNLAASEAYTTFRGALLDGTQGTSPLSRILRAEALRDLTFDEKFQERPGSSVVHLRLQHLSGTRSLPNPARPDKETFSGGVAISFMQYEPNGKLKNSGVFTGYAAPVAHPKESKPGANEDKQP